MTVPWETFPALVALPGFTHAFTRRTAADTKSDEFARRFLADFGYARAATAEQTHGTGVTVVADLPAGPVPGVDALVTRVPGLPLLVRCADCAAVFLLDRATPAIGLVHSGRTGTAGNIVGHTLATMRQQFGTDPGRCVAAISPSIGPCHYEVDLWTGLERQLQTAGVGAIHNPRCCTACHLDRYFSYRAEKGRTGRMLALLALNPRRL